MTTITGDGDSPEIPRDKVQGLDPRALLAHAWGSTPKNRPWEPPPVVELQGHFPQYEVLALIGRGGMGAVYQARQRSLDRLVALKILPVEAGEDAAFAQRFQAEARTLAKLQHPHIVTVYDSGRSEHGLWYIVMEYVDGGDVGALLREGSLAAARTLQIAGEVCSALAFAHACGVVHRDIKPANILLTREGRVKVADFGLAALHVDAASSDARLTATGTFVGTPDYMAPEQRSGEWDARSDIYSMSVVLYEMLTGKLPQGAWAAPSQLTGSDARLDLVVRRAMQPNPADRYTSVVLLCDELAKLSRPGKTRRNALIAVGLFVPLAAGLSAWWRGGFRSHQGSVEPTPMPAPPHPLARVDLAHDIVAGTWSWVDGAVGGTVFLPLNDTQNAKRLQLPVQPGTGAYDLIFELWLDTPNSDAGVILRVGRSRVGLLLNLQRSSGLGLVDGMKWDKNPSSVWRTLPQESWMRFRISIRPGESRATVTVLIDGQPFIFWQGPEASLTLYEEPPQGWSLPDIEAIGFASYRGGCRFRGVRIIDVAR